MVFAKGAAVVVSFAVEFVAFVLLSVRDAGDGAYASGTGVVALLALIAWLALLPLLTFILKMLDAYGQRKFFAPIIWLLFFSQM